ncbi:hypothetical protein VCHA29O37_330017 [Vibrio chagasii]|nr:hypothetical protein VCHA29O37_330017 [Vibrio chagasii]
MDISFHILVSVQDLNVIDMEYWTAVITADYLCSISASEWTLYGLWQSSHSYSPPAGLPQKPSCSSPQ